MKIKCIIKFPVLTLWLILCLPLYPLHAGTWKEGTWPSHTCYLPYVSYERGFGQTKPAMGLFASSEFTPCIAASFNPLGFLQFGPILNVEAGVIPHLMINTHLRLSKVGLLSYTIRSTDGGVDDLDGIAFGGGLIYFFREQYSRFYLGTMLEYEKAYCWYLEYTDWEWYEEESVGIFVINGGYRFSFPSNIFINAGLFAGFYRTHYNWYYTQPSQIGYGITGGSGTKDPKPFFMAELSLGYCLKFKK